MTAPGKDEQRNRDEHWMRVAMDWSRKGQGWTSPRPSVGCAIVKDGVLLGGGHTTPGDGNPHAEVVALRSAAEAGHDVRGATAYVTLEPCSHFATTPPCSTALLEAGISRVVAGVRDPNPAVDGRGYKQLREGGVEVVEDFLTEECACLHEQFLTHISQRRPFVTLKVAISLDGKIALHNGESKWITGEESRRRGHMLRHEHDAVLVGIETVLKDDPQLNVRLEGQWKQPARVVVDSRGRLPLDARLWQDKGSRLFVATTPKLLALDKFTLEHRGAHVLTVQPTEDRVDFPELFSQLYENGIFSVLVEGGARIASSVLRSGCADKLVCFQAPFVMGKGKDVFSEFSIDHLEDAPRLKNVSVERIGEDSMISGYLK